MKDFKAGDNVRFNLFGKEYYGSIENVMLNSRYETGKSYNYNLKHGGHTYHINAFTYIDGKQKDIYLEVSSDNAEEMEHITSKDLHEYIIRSREPIDKSDFEELPDFFKDL